MALKVQLKARHPQGSEISPSDFLFSASKYVKWKISPLEVFLFLASKGGVRVDGKSKFQRGPKAQGPTLE